MSAFAYGQCGGKQNNPDTALSCRVYPQCKPERKAVSLRMEDRFATTDPEHYLPTTVCADPATASSLSSCGKKRPLCLIR
eukprot:6193927-Pleurochrysis_carterae.AAC.1